MSILEFVHKCHTFHMCYRKQPKTWFWLDYGTPTKTTNASIFEASNWGPFKPGPSRFVCNKCKVLNHGFYTKVLFAGIGFDPSGKDYHFRMTVHVVHVCCSFDLPARATVQNFIQSNGAFGCCFCEQPGVTVRSEIGGTLRNTTVLHTVCKNVSWKTLCGRLNFLTVHNCLHA